jgi:predicted choloylglycine hydrolase
MDFVFRAWAEDAPGELWAARFGELWPDYRRWYLSQGEDARPSYLACERALLRWMPEMVPAWQRHCELSGGQDLQARFLSLWCPPPYLSGCSQAAFLHGTPLLVRNYDYHPRLLEGLFVGSAWTGRRVLASSDCVLGALDGLNDAGLSASLSFGGKRETCEGFGAPLVLRYVLEVCTNVREACEVFRRVPCHMAYNFLLVDRTGDFATVFVTPGARTRVLRRAASTNHQEEIVWPRHARASATLAREGRLNRLVAEERDPVAFVDAFLRPPLHNTRYEQGFGTLYTASYSPAESTVRFLWPTTAWQHSLSNVDAGTRTISLAIGEDRAIASPE